MKTQKQERDLENITFTEMNKYQLLYYGTIFAIYLITFAYAVELILNQFI